MTKGILGRKIGMTQVFAENGDLIPVTVIQATPNVVLQKKTVDTDGYGAIQLGFEDKREKLANKPEKGHVTKANTAPFSPILNRHSPWKFPPHSPWQSGRVCRQPSTSSQSKTNIVYYT